MSSLYLLRAIFSQALHGLLTHPTTQLVTIATVAASLSILSTALNLAFNLEALSTQWKQGGEILLFTKPGVTEAQVEDLRTQIAQWPEVSVVHMRTAEDARQELAQVLGDTLSIDRIDLEILPYTLEIEIHNTISKQKRIALRAQLLSFEWVADVESITEGKGLLAKLYELRDALKFWIWLIGTWIATSVAFVIAQLVRLNLFHRRKELEVLQSVGATDRFIQMPLMIEAGVQGALGAIVALSLVASLMNGFIEQSSAFMRLLNLKIIFLPMWVSVLFVLSAMMIGIVSSWRASRIFLREEQ